MQKLRLGGDKELVQESLDHKPDLFHAAYRHGTSSAQEQIV